MSIADALPAVLSARAERAAQRDAQRLLRDAFIQAEFATLSAQFEALLAEALGRHAQIEVTATLVPEPVQGRSFTTLDTRVLRARASFGPHPRTVTFTPQLDFRHPQQFGRIACAIDFPFTPRAARTDTLARDLLALGIQMRGETLASLMRADGSAWVALTARDLEDAFTAWWLK